MHRACVICKAINAKYKCPICLVYYCSVTCCKQHRLDKCDVVKKIETENPQEPPENKPTNATGLYPTEDTVELSKMQSLANNTPLKDILSNRHLQSLLSSVNEAEDAEAAMASAMQEPIFVEFANACLAAIEGRK